MKALEDLREQSEQRSYDINDLCDKTGLSPRTVRAVLSGENKNPTYETITSLARYFSGEIVFRTGGDDYLVHSGDVSYYRRLLAEKQDQLNAKDRWIFRLFVVCLGLISICIIVSLLCFRE